MRQRSIKKQEGRAALVADTSETADRAIVAEVGARLKHLRAAAGLTLEELCGRSGVSRWLDRTTVTIGASNVFDRDVPFYFTGLASTGIAGLYYSPLSDPIQRFVYMTVKKSF